MRFLDALLGVPACIFLTLLRYLGGPTPERPLDMKRRKILFIKLAEQGSTILARPMLQRAAEIFGRNNLYFLVFDDNRFVLDALGIIPTENVITIPHETITQVLFGAIKAIRKARGIGFDFAIDMEFFARSTAALAYLSGARWRIGFHAFHGEAAYRGNLMTHRLICNQHIHTADLFEVMLDAVFEDPRQLPTFGKKIPAYVESSETEAPLYKLRSGELDETRDIVRAASGDKPSHGLPLILLNSNCGDLIPLRRWHEDNYRDLTQRLLRRYPELHVGFTGGPSEKREVEKQVAAIDHPRCFNLAGLTSLRQLMALYFLAEIMVTNDSGPAHFSSLAPIDTVTLFGPENPALFRARSPRSHVFWAGLACSPCVTAANGRNTVCRNNLCMQAINVDDVYQKVCELYEKRRKRKTTRRKTPLRKKPARV